MKAGDIVTFQHPQTGQVTSGEATGKEWPEHNAICVYVPSVGTRVVRRANVLAETTVETIPAA